MEKKMEATIAYWGNTVLSPFKVAILFAIHADFDSSSTLTAT